MIEYLEEDEKVESIVFGYWGWTTEGEENPKQHTLDMLNMGLLDEDEGDFLIPFEKREIPLSLEEAKPLMESWSFRTGSAAGSPKCFATNIWTNERVIFHFRKLFWFSKF